MSWNLISINSNYKEVQNSIERSDYESLLKNAETIQQGIQNIRRSLNTLTAPLGVVSYEDEIEKIDTFMGYYEDYSQSIRDISFALAPFNEYLNSFINNTSIRKSNEGYLSLSQEGVSYLDKLSEITNRSIFYNKGIEKQKRVINSIKDNSLPPLPEFIYKELQKVNKYIQDLDSINQDTEIYSLIPYLLGNLKPTSYLILIADNTRPAPIGGDISAYSVLTFQNGGIQAVEVKSIDDITDFQKEISDEILKKINARRFRYKSKDDLKVSDISSIENIEEFSKVAEVIFEDVKNFKINNVIVLSLESFEEIIRIINENGSEINISGTELDSELLTKIQELQTGNESLESKHELIAELTATILNNILNFWKEHPGKIKQRIDSLLYNEKIKFYSNIPQVFEAYEFEEVYDADTYFVPGLMVTDPKVVYTDKYPNTTLILETEISEDLKIKNNLNISFPSIGSSQEVSVCLPDTIRISSIKIEEGLLLRSRINTSENQLCAVAQILNETEFKISWEDETFFVTEGEPVNISLGIGNINGTRTELDHIIRADRSLIVKNENGEIVSSDFGSIELIEKDFIKKLTITKR